MKSIDELIAEFCPDGVEYKPLGDILDYEQPTKYIVSDTNYDESYSTPVLTAGASFILGYTNEKHNHYKASKKSPVIIFDDFTTSYKWVDFEFKVKSSAMKILTNKDDSVSDIRFVFYSMHTIKFEALTHSRHWIEKYSGFEIPLPPLAVQKEIVRILDGFTRLIDELEAELVARRKQYEQYRDRIFDYGDSNSYCCLGEVVRSLNTGLNPRQFFKLNTKDATNYYVTIREIHDGKIVFSDKTDKINDIALSLCNNRSNLEVGDVLFSGTGTIGETAVVDEPPTNWNIKEGVYAVKPDSSKVLSRYLHYAFMCSSVRKAYGARIFGGTVKSISMKDLLKIKIPIPPLAEQKRIVEILDKFDALCNDATAGLTAEIAARKKQYEYYRDKLLSFKKAS